MTDTKPPPGGKAPKDGTPPPAPVTRPEGPRRHQTKPAAGAAWERRYSVSMPAVTSPATADPAVTNRAYPPVPGRRSITPPSARPAADADPLEIAIYEACQRTPECLAVGAVDMNTGMLLGVKTVEDHPQEVLDLVAAATAEQYQGQTVTEIESHFRAHRGMPEDKDLHYLQTVIWLTDHTTHVFSRCKRRREVVVVIVCRATVNPGNALAHARRARDRVESVLITQARRAE